MSYKALYRLWRPQRFSEIVGQKHITQTLKNALENDKIAHAYLLSGPRGTGKTSTAKIIAKTVNCTSPEAGEACNECHNCQLINSGNSMDVIEIDGASNRGIDEIRELRDKINLSPAQGKYKVYIIDEVHMLTGEAFNALLKTLEEPPKHVIFIMATTEPHKVPATVLSRCQRFDFKRLNNEEMVSRMKEICESQSIAYEEAALYSIARFADGGMRDALSILDQCLSYCADNKLKLEDIQQVIGIVDYTFLNDVLMAIIEKDIKKILIKISELVSSGKDLEGFIFQILDYMRNILLLKVCQSSELLQVPQGEIELLQKLSAKLSQNELTQIMDLLTDVQKEMKWSTNGRLLLETAFVKAVRVKDISYDSLLKRVEHLEKIITEGSIVTSKNDTDKKVKETNLLDKKTDNDKKVNLKDTVNSSQEKMTASSIDFERIKSSWTEFLEAVKKNKVTIYAFLVEGNPSSFQNGTLTLTFKENYAFHFDKLSQKENKAVVVATLKEFYGIDINLSLKMENEQTLKDNSYNNKNEDSHDDDSIVQEAIKLFGGSVVEIID